MKTRFCPSPTGHLHIGNIRTALFNALFASNQAGHFLLRIEDTDQARSDSAHTQQLIEDLHWLGMSWQEGPKTAIPNSDYFQSQRLDLYNDHIDRLISQKAAYSCFCSDESLSQMRAAQVKAKQPPRYDGRCRKLSQTQVDEKIAAGEASSIRLYVPDEAEIVFNDTLKGRMIFHCRHLGDFVIRRSSGMPNFLFTNAIDDALMGVTHVLRGEDHLSNTPKQILILQHLNLPVPAYTHMPMIVNHDGKPLSKRLGWNSIKMLREQGYLPEAITNYVARLGHPFEDSLFDISALGQAFSMEKIAKSAVTFDEKQMLFWQKKAISALTESEFWAWCANAADNIPDDKKSAFYQLLHEEIAFPSEVEAWGCALFQSDFSQLDAVISFFKAQDDSLLDVLKAQLEAHKPFDDIKSSLKAAGLSNKVIFKSLRFILSGREHGPALGDIYAIVDSEIISQRFTQLAKELA